jgi:hypothetical protein
VTYKSEKVLPEDMEGPVKVVKGDSFKDIVSGGHLGRYSTFVGCGLGARWRVVLKCSVRKCAAPIKRHTR